MDDYTILLAAKKGGVGKSTLAAALAVELMRNDHDTAIFDLDHYQQSSGSFIRRRTELGLENVPAYYTGAHIADIKRDCSGHSVTVIDAPGDCDSIIKTLAKLADIVIIPTTAAIFDVDGTIIFARELERLGVRPFVILSHETQGQLNFAAEYLGSAGIKIGAEIPRRPSMSNAAAHGKTILETGYASITTPVDNAIQNIFNTLGDQ